MTREQAIKSLSDLFERTFGSEKGSREDYEAWAADQGLCDEWDGEEPIEDRHHPPGELEFLMALGVTQQELVSVLHINPKIFGEVWP